MKKMATFVKTWEASGNGVFEAGLGGGQAYASIFASYKPKRFLYFQRANKNGLGEAYDCQEDLDAFNESGFKDFRDRTYVKRYFERIEKAISHNKATTARIGKQDFAAVSSARLAKLFEASLRSIQMNFNVYLACQPQRFIKLEAWLQEMISKHSSKDAAEIFRLLSTPTEKTLLGEEQTAWLKVLIRLKEKKISHNTKQAARLLAKHHSTYAILGAADGRQPWPVEHYAMLLQEESRSIRQLQSDLEAIGKRRLELKKQQKSLIRRYGITKEVQYYCRLLGDIGHRRLAMRIEGWVPLYESLKKVIEALARSRGYDEELIRYCSIDELLDVARGSDISHDLLRRRKNAYLMVYEYPKTRVFDGDEAEDMFKEIVPPENFAAIKEVRGMPAMKGKIIGQAVLFQWGDNMEEKIESIKNTDNPILVTGQTRPQLMPLIARCAAIVTDEGGITSHSAIVSRELGIPCVVGTRIATRVFKDNDRVEVDAHTGVVRLV